MTIRELTAQDRQAVSSLCGESPEWDVFLLANLDQLSGDGSLVQYWGQFDPAGSLTSVLMRYHVLWYAHLGFGEDPKGLASVIEAQGQPKITLNEGGVAEPHLAGMLVRHRMDLGLPGRLRRLRATEGAALGRRGQAARAATLEDVDRLTDFYAAGPQDVRRGSDSLRRSVTGGRRTYLVEAGYRVTAAALTTAELPSLAMIGGLFAVPDVPGGEREEHLESALRGLIGSLAAEGRDVCVVSRDAWIDAVLDRLGFATLGPWWMLHISRLDGVDGSTV